MNRIFIPLTFGPAILNQETEIAGQGRIQGFVQSILNGHDLDMARKHLSPGENLRQIPNQPLATKPGEKKDNDGKSLSRHG